MTQTQTPRTLALAVLRHLVSKVRESGMLEEHVEDVLAELAEGGDAAPDVEALDLDALELALDTLLEY